MTAKDAVFDLLKKQKQTSGSKNLEARRKEWKEALNQLMEQFCQWLKPAESQKLLEVHAYTSSIWEEKLGGYDVPALKIIMSGSQVVEVVPRSLLVLGANGRVDFEGSTKKAILVRNRDNQWQFAELSPATRTWEYRDLNEETFWETIHDLIVWGESGR
jgi:ADP-ribosylglycohydrolase